MNFKNVVMAGLLVMWDYEASCFAENPSAARFKDVTNLMYSIQMIKFSSVEQCAKMLADVPVEKWVTTIVKHINI